MKKIDVSIIVPVYNGEKTIENCLKSLLEQSLKKIEIIVIDDGSCDKTAEILDSMQQKDPEILRVIHQENTGVWRARKNAITLAQGRYIGFCDADDIVEHQMYQVLFEKIVEQNAEIAVCSYQRYKEGQPVGKPEMQWPDDVLEIGRETLGLLALVNTALWNKLYNAEILKKAVEFSEPPRIAEDMMMILSIIPYVKRIAFVEQAMYHYNVYDGSAMNSISEIDAQKTMNAMVALKKQMPPCYNELVDIMAFIHIGISLPIGLYSNPEKHKTIKFGFIREYLNRNFPKWRKNNYTRTGYVWKNRKMLKIWGVQKIYQLHLFTFFVRIYIFIVSKFNVNLKW